MEEYRKVEYKQKEMAEAKEKIALLARLMNDTPAQINPELCQKCVELYNFINDDFAAILENSTLHGKDEILNELNIALQTVDILKEHTEVIGDTVIGFLGSDPTIFSDIFNIQKETIHELFPSENLTIPTIWTHDEPYRLVAENIYDAQVSITTKDIGFLFKYLDNVKIDSLVRFFYFCEPAIPENITVFTFPSELKGMSEVNKALLEKVDVFVTVWDGKVTQEKKLLEQFLKYTEDNGAVFFIAVKDEKNLKASYRELLQLLHLAPQQNMQAGKKKGQINIQIGTVTVKLVTIEALKEELAIISEKNESRKNYSFKDTMEAIFFRIIV